MTKTSKTHLSTQEQPSLSLLPAVPPLLDQTDDNICRKFRPLVASLARSLAPGYSDPDDLRQEGFVGLLEAVSHFDPNRGVKLSTFAYPYIRGRILNFLRAERQYYLKLESEWEYGGRRYLYLSEFITRNESDPDTGLTLEEMIPSPASVNLEEKVGFFLLREKIETALLVLTTREREVMTLHYWGDLSPSEIAEKIGVSRPRITKILQRSLEKLRLQMRFN